jgi:hypothetical protein
MSCLSVIIKRLSESLALVVKRIGGIAVEIHRCDAPIVVTASDAGKHLKVMCGIVCDVSNLHYLRVSPQEVQWITPNEGIIYNVESDTDWIVLTS